MTKLRAYIAKTTRNVFLLGMFCAVLVMAIGLLCGNGDMFEYLNAENITGEDLSTLSQSNMDKSINYYAKDLVRLDVDFVVDYCATDDDGIYYVVPYAERYMIVYVPFNRANEFQKLYDNSRAYDKGVTDSINWRPAKVRGVIYPMDETLAQYAKEMFVEYDMAADENEAGSMLTAFTLYGNSFFDWVDVFTYVFSGLAAVCFVAAIVLTVMVRPSIDKQLKKQNIAFEELENDLEVSYKAPGGVMGQHYTLISSVRVTDTNVVRNDEVLWAYLFTQTTTHTTYGIKTGTTYDYSVRLACRDGKIYNVHCGKNQSDAESYLDYIRANFPAIVVGHTAERAVLFASDREAFAAMAASGEHRSEIIS